MDLINGILTRRSVRQFDSTKEISRDDLEEVIKVAQYPSLYDVSRDQLKKYRKNDLIDKFEKNIQEKFPNLI